MKVYLAGPLFSEAERAWTRHIRRVLESAAPGIRFIWPYELITEQEIEALGPERAKSEIFDRDRRALDESDALIAVLDGPQVDDETAMAIGYFHALKEDAIILGLRTDFRRTGMHNRANLNGVVDCACTHIFTQVCDLVDFLSCLVGQKEQNDEMALV